MATRKPNYYKAIRKTLDELHESYPTYDIGRHLSTALSDYGDIWGMSDKEMAFALKKYQEELALDVQNLASDEYVNKIVKDAEDLDHILDEDEEGGENYE